MGLIKKDVFVCLDCEATGLDTEKDRIVEISAMKFTFEEILQSFDYLINPQMPIPEEVQKIHNISDAMVQDKPLIQAILPEVLKFIDNHIIVGHSIEFDINLIRQEAKRCNLSNAIPNIRFIDTLRLARLYGECPENSLQRLRAHFNIAEEGAHRAMNDVVVNIEVFKNLTRSFKTTEEVLERLKKPIMLQAMPLGKHKGRKFTEIPQQYLEWAAHQNFDQDLLYPINWELKKRRKRDNFSQAGNPFSNL